MIEWDINRIYHDLMGYYWTIPWLNGILLDYTMIEWDINGIYHDLMGYYWTIP